MAIKISPKITATFDTGSSCVTTDVINELANRQKADELAFATRNRNRKPSGKAKVAVTLRLSKECMAYFEREFGDDFRMQMQAVIESSRR